MVSKEDDVALSEYKVQYLFGIDNFLLEAVNISDEVKDKLIVITATNTVRKEGASSESNENNHRWDDDRDDDVDGKDHQPDEQQHAGLKQRYLIVGVGRSFRKNFHSFGTQGNF